MRFVGIDPSTKTGLAILDDNGKIWTDELTTKEPNELERLVDIATQIRDLLYPEDVICIEGFSYGSKGQGVSFQYGLGWIVRYTLWEFNFKYTEIPPTSLKKFATNKGNAKKEDMILPIYKRWGFENNSDNIRDAYVLAQIAKAIHHQEGLTEFQKDVMKKIV